MFETFELSRFFARRTALYRFARGAQLWRFTSADRPVTIAGETFLAAPGISHTEVRESVSSAQKNQVTITLPYRLDPAADDLPVTQSLGDNWHPYPPGQRVLVDILAVHLSDPDLQTTVEWMGRVIGPEFGDVELKLVCDPSYRSGRMSGTSPRFQRGCGVPIYSQGLRMCNLDKAAQAVPATLTAVSGLQLTAAAFASAPRDLAGGLFEWTREDGLQESKSILAHTGDAIVINYGAADLAPGLVGIAYPGCAHNREACIAYDNEINYPGWKDIPTEDPMPRSQAW